MNKVCNKCAKNNVSSDKELGVLEVSYPSGGKYAFSVKSRQASWFLGLLKNHYIFLVFAKVIVWWFHLLEFLVTSV